VSVDQSDGLSEDELTAYVARSMARVEVLRNREFNTTVPVSVISRETFRNRSLNQSTNASAAAWNNQVWEALFIVGEETDAQQTLQATSGASVAGFYDPQADEIKIITPAPSQPVIDNSTLIHELTHALQDQYFNISRAKYHGETQDEQLAVDGLLEGEAAYIQEIYVQRCGAVWSCVDTPARFAQNRNGGGQPNLGVLLVLLQPQSDGPVYIKQLVERGGWDAVTQSFEQPPSSSEQIIHTTDERPMPIPFQDTAARGWKLFPDQGSNGSGTVGESSLYAMFWYQARTASAQTIDLRSLFRTEDEFDRFNYVSEPSAGWANDRVFPYRKQTGIDTHFGYVWVTAWDTEADAAEFKAAYLEILEAQDATRIDNPTWVIESGPFADAFRVVQRGNRVVIVNGPTVEALDALRPGLADRQTGDPTPTLAPPTETPTPGTTAARTRTTTTPVPGFGIVVALIGLAIVLVLAHRKQS
jgi:PGF-CTERM protein